MARPKSIRLEDGIVLLKNFSPERSKQLEDAILGATTVKVGDQLTVQDEVVKVVNPSDLTEQAYGYFYDAKAKQFMLAVIKYNPEFKTCVLSSTKPIGEYRAYATNAFKIELVNSKLI